MNLKKTIRKILKEEFNLREGKSKMELTIMNLIENSLDKELLGDNFSGVSVDIYDTKYGKNCKIVGLFKNPYKPKISDMLIEKLMEAKRTVMDVFTDYFNDVYVSTSTVDSYLRYKGYNF